MKEVPARGPSVGALAALTFAAFAGFYGATWSGRYFHDGAFFANRFEEGHLYWVHLGYLPAAALLRWVLSVFHAIADEAVLGLLSMLSGALALALCCVIACRVSGSRAAGVATALLLGLSPTSWFHSTIVEIHGFAALGTSLGVWIAIQARIPCAVAVGLATLVAGIFHLTGVLLLPFLILVAIEARAGGVVQPRLVLGATLGGLLGVAAVRLQATFDPAGVVSTSSDSAFGVLSAVGHLLAHPAFLAGQVWNVLCLPWGVVVVAPLALLWIAPPPLVRVRRALVAVLLALELVVAAIPAERGMYGTILLPALAWAVAPVAARVLSARRGRACIAGALVLQLAMAAPIVHDWRHDPDQEWARRAAEFVERPAAILCQRSSRVRYLHRREVSAAEIPIQLRPAPSVLGEALARRAAELLAEGSHVYIDRHVFEDDGLPHVRALADELRARLVLEGAPGDPVLRVVAVREPPPAPR